MQPRITAKAEGPAWRGLLAGGILVLAAAGVAAGGGAARLADGMATVRALGGWGPAVFVGLYALACVLFVPGSVLTLGAGVLFGVLLGTVVVSVGSTLGATLAFLLGRHAAREWVAGRLRRHPRFEAIDRAIEAEGWKIVALLRLTPMVPFNLLNYGLGLTRVRLRDYILASWVAMLPGTVLYVYLGSVAGSLAELSSTPGRSGRTPAEWALVGVGLVASVGVASLAARMARQALSAKVGGKVSPAGETTGPAGTRS